MALTIGTSSAVCWTGMFTLTAALIAGSATVQADTPTVQEMDRYVAKMAAQDLEILANLEPKELWVAPSGKPTNSGAKESPLDLKTAYTNPKLVTPGTIVWITGGKYEIGDLKPETVCGTRQKPIIFRTVPGARATINAQIWSKAGCDHIWWWGVGDAVVRNNTFWAPQGMVAVSFAPAEAINGKGTPKVVFEKNTYIDNGRFDLAAFQAFINSGQTDRLVKGQGGRPSERYVFKRVNRYEPQRVHLAVYNWPKTPSGGGVFSCHGSVRVGVGHPPSFRTITNSSGQAAPHGMSRFAPPTTGLALYG